MAKPKITTSIVEPVAPDATIAEKVSNSNTASTADGRTEPKDPSKTKDLKSLANAFAQKQDMDIFVLNSGIDMGLDVAVLKALQGRKKKHSKLLLVICTRGGDANIAFRIARFIQEQYVSFHAAVQGSCKSAGTLICIGATDLHMGKLGQLGPLDVQLAKPDELGEISSGVTALSSFQSLQSASFNYFEGAMTTLVQKSRGRIKTITAADIASKLTIGLFAPIYAQMDPVKMGEDFRSTTVAADYARRLNIQGKNLKDDEAISSLIVGYSSHGFIIDKLEAASLFHRVHAINDELLEVLNLLGRTIIYPHNPDKGETPVLQFLNDEAKE